MCEVELAAGDKSDEKRDVDDRTESRTEPESRLDIALGASASVRRGRLSSAGGACRWGSSARVEVTGLTWRPFACDEFTECHCCSMIALNASAPRFACGRPSSARR